MFCILQRAKPYLFQGQKDSYVPTSNDIRSTRRILTSFGLPTELALQILDYARYWTLQTGESTERIVLYDTRQDIDFSEIEPYLWLPLDLSPEYDGEIPKIRELEFTIVSHDQGYTTPETSGSHGSYNTSSWFEVSHCRERFNESFDHIDELDQICTNLEQIRKGLHDYAKFLPRPSQEMEPQRKHCPEMMKITWSSNYKGWKPAKDEGTHAWWLQGNEVARDISIFEGEMVKRYHVVWGCAANPRWEGNEGSGRGEGFVDSLKDGEQIVVFARVKVI
jgi:hypothetical protein